MRQTGDRDVKDQPARLQDIGDDTPPINRDALLRSLDLAAALARQGVRRRSFRLAAPDSLKRVRILDRHPQGGPVSCTQDSELGMDGRHNTPHRGAWTARP
jgi:hypothetical protein